MREEIEWNIGDVCIDLYDNDIHFIIDTKGLTKFNWRGFKRVPLTELEISEGVYSYPQKIKLLNILYGEFCDK